MTAGYGASDPSGPTTQGTTIVSRQGAVVQPPLKAISSHIVKVLKTELYPASVVIINGQASVNTKVSTRGYGECDLPDGTEKPIIIPYLTTVMEDDFGEPVDGGPDDGDQGLNIETTPQNDAIFGMNNFPDSLNRYQTDSYGGEGLATDAYGTYDYTGTKGTHPAKAKKDKHVRKPKHRILRGKGLTFTTTLAPDETPGTSDDPNNNQDNKGIGVDLADDGGLIFAGTDSNGIAINLKPKSGLVIDHDQLAALVDGVTVTFDANGALQAAGAAGVYVPGRAITMNYDALSGGSGSGGSGIDVNVEIASVNGAYQAGLCDTGGDDQNGLMINLASSQGGSGGASGGGAGMTPIYPAFLPASYKSQYTDGHQTYMQFGEAEDNPHEEGTLDYGWWNAGYFGAQAQGMRATLLVGGDGGGGVDGGGGGGGSLFGDVFGSGGGTFGTDFPAAATCSGALYGSGLTIVAGDGNSLAVWLAQVGAANVSGLGFGGDDGEGLLVQIAAPSGLVLTPDGLSIELATDDSGSGTGPTDVSALIITGGLDGNGLAVHYNTSDFKLDPDGALALKNAGGGGSLDITHNGTDVGVQPVIDFQDSSSIIFTVSDDGDNNRITVSAATNGTPSAVYALHSNVHAASGTIQPNFDTLVAGTDAYSGVGNGGSFTFPADGDYLIQAAFYWSNYLEGFSTDAQGYDLAIDVETWRGTGSFPVQKKEFQKEQHFAAEQPVDGFEHTWISCLLAGVQAGDTMDTVFQYTPTSGADVHFDIEGGASGSEVVTWLSISRIDGGSGGGGGGGGGGTDTDALSSLTDVVLTTPVLGDMLSFDGTHWINGPSLALPTGGTDGQVLREVGTTPTWTDPPWIVNPMTTTGQLIVGGTGGTPTTLAPGLVGKILGLSGTPGSTGVPAWVDQTTINGLHGNVTLVQGSGITLSTSGTTITVAVDSSTLPPDVSSLNSTTGAITIAGTGGIAVTTSGSTITIDGSSVTGGGGGTSINWRGAYNGGATYAANDAVAYQGSSWIALGATTGNTPVVGAYWDLLAQVGMTGPTGPTGPIGITWQGAWSAATSYVIDDAVYYNGASYIATQASLNVTPTTGAPFWSVLVGTQAGIPFSTLSDVAIVSPANGDFVRYNLSTGKWYNTSTIPLASLDGTGASTGNAVIWNGSAWAPGVLSGGGGGVATATPTVFGTVEVDNAMSGAPRAVTTGSLTPAGTAGAPTSGTYYTGQPYVDSGYALYVCTAGGTPGTWQKISSGGPFDVASFVPGQPFGSQLVLSVLTPGNVTALTLPANMAGAVGKVGVSPLGTAIYSVQKNGAAIGTISISPAGVFSFATTGGAAVTFASGDELSVIAPSAQDPALTDVRFTLSLTRS